MSNNKAEDSRWRVMGMATVELTRFVRDVLRLLFFLYALYATPGSLLTCCRLLALKFA